MVFVIARSCFASLQTGSTITWLPFDYICDAFYILDIIVRQRTGKSRFAFASFWSEI